MRTKRLVIGTVLVVMVLTLAMGIAIASQDDTGRGGPSGPHYTLNILGKAWDDKAPIEDCGEGHRIFVKLGQAENLKKGKSAIKATTDIMLTEGPFAVIDCDGTDGEATFQLPDPNGGKSGCTAYSVWIRALGKPGGDANMVLCATYDDPCDPSPPGEICGDVVELRRRSGKGHAQKFRNVSLELLTICVYICTDYNETTQQCDDGYWERMYLFDPRLEDELWRYNNKGLKHAQIRFYYEEDCSRAGEWGCP
ncbi:MAG: hypothetical protein ACYSR8_06470 [Planctomycetota bacterium]